MVPSRRLQGKNRHGRGFRLKLLRKAGTMMIDPFSFSALLAIVQNRQEAQP
jgi:hypothetical protein